MSLADDLKTEIRGIFRNQWTVREGQVVPEPESIQLGNHAVHFDRATILYADLHGSTDMVQAKKWGFAAEVYKTYLACTTRIIKSEGGSITSYDGDRVMGVFIGERQSNIAARTALKINYAVTYILQPALKAQYTTTDFAVRHTVGIDTSEISVARTGVRGDNDLVFVGRAANYAAKLTELNNGHTTYITDSVYNYLSEDNKVGGEPRRSMWEARLWTPMNNHSIYRSNWWWKVE